MSQLWKPALQAAVVVIVVVVVVVIVVVVVVVEVAAGPRDTGCSNLSTATVSFHISKSVSLQV